MSDRLPNLPGAGKATFPARPWNRLLVVRAAAVTGMIGAVIGTLIVPSQPWLIWNVSESAPIGLYAVGSRHALTAGDVVAAQVPRSWRTLAAMRRYIPANVPLIKRIAASPGDHVCTVGALLLVNGKAVAARRAQDGAGRRMPWWSGCRRLPRHAYLLLMDDGASFDGRYFGPTHTDDIVGEVELLWSR